MGKCFWGILKLVGNIFIIWDLKMKLMFSDIDIL